MRAARYIVLLVCLCGLVSGVYADVTPARILVGTSEAPLSPAPVFDGARVLAPVGIISALGATSVSSTSGESITVTAASGQSGEIKTVIVNGEPMIPMDKLIALVGGEQVWDAKSKTLKLLAHLESVEFDNDTLKINCSFPARASTKLWNGKIIVDVAGAKVASEAKEVYIGTAAVARARLGQFNGTTARVVLDLNKTTGYELQSQGAAAQILLKVGDNLVSPPNSPSPPQPAARALSITGVSVQPVDGKSFDVVVSTSGRPKASNDFSVQPPRIVLGLPAEIDPVCAVTGSSPLVTCQLTKTASGAKLTLTLTRPMGYRFEISDTALTVHVRPPDKSGGTLAGKLIVIDPGHGGKQKGAIAGGVEEKAVNVRIAKELAAALAKQGAKTLLTHDTDVFMEQGARAKVAIDKGADFFIAIHCNSNYMPESTTGIETYYHMQEPSPKTLAYMVHDGVCKYTGMCDLHPRSDGKLWAIGLGVLRTLSGSGIPGVLVECGYINNSSDRAKLLDARYRSKLAAGIVAGIKAYIEGVPVE